MILSKRLETIIYLVDQGENVADIGSDHGFIVIELINRNIAASCLAVENKIGPYTNLVKNTSLIKNIKTSLSDGLKEVDKQFSTVIIAGMGFNTIKEIINDSIEKLDFIDTFIIDSHTLTYELRKFMSEIGYCIKDEKCLIENKIFYEIIKFQKGHKVYSEVELKYGPILLNNRSEDFITHYSNQIEKLKSLVRLHQISSIRKKEIALEISSLEAIIYEN
ncbi:MAG: class I SAM-dependent methyltransferase [Candidatus Onthovivens sp.]|nr:class I SAM-dependent methyltransferase [Candidatus Onthovivens sp.]